VAGKCFSAPPIQSSRQDHCGVATASLPLELFHFDHLGGRKDRRATSERLPSQWIDPTYALSVSAGAPNPKVFRGMLVELHGDSVIGVKTAATQSYCGDGMLRVSGVRARHRKRFGNLEHLVTPERRLSVAKAIR